MTDILDLKARIRVLEDIDEIKKLKGRYWRCVDKKLWDELGECFAEDGEIAYEVHGQIKGRQAIIDDFIARNSGEGSSRIRIHQGHNPEINITGPDSATGTWQLYHYCIDQVANNTILLAGFYDDEYSRENGEWKLKSTKHAKVFREEFGREGITLVE